MRKKWDQNADVSKDCNTDSGSCDTLEYIQFTVLRCNLTDIALIFRKLLRQFQHFVSSQFGHLDILWKNVDMFLKFSYFTIFEPCWILTLSGILAIWCVLFNIFVTAVCTLWFAQISKTDKSPDITIKVSKSPIF